MADLIVICQWARSWIGLKLGAGLPIPYQISARSVAKMCLIWDFFHVITHLSSDADGHALCIEAKRNLLIIQLILKLIFKTAYMFKPASKHTHTQKHPTPTPTATNLSTLPRKNTHRYKNMEIKSKTGCQ